MDDIQKAEEKKKKIDSEKRKLKRVLKDIPDDTKKAVDKLIGNAAFMGVSLEILQDDINKNGWECEYKNGENQYGTKKSPAAELYNPLLKNYASVIAQLCSLLPVDGAERSEVFGFFNDKFKYPGKK